MDTCKWAEKVQAYFDNEPQLADGVQAHLAQCGECSLMLRRMEALRAAAVALPRPRGIEDAQFNAFMAGIRDEIQAPPRGARNWWAMLSLVGAALVVALAVFSMFTGPEPVKATEVKATSTQIEGATVDVKTMDGVVTIAVSPPRRYQEDIQ